MVPFRRSCPISAMKALAEFCESVRNPAAILKETHSEGPDLVASPAVAKVCAAHSHHRVAVPVPRLGRSSEAPPHIDEAVEPRCPGIATTAAPVRPVAGKPGGDPGIHAPSPGLGADCRVKPGVNALKS